MRRGGVPLSLAKWRNENEVEEKRSGWQEKKIEIGAGQPEKGKACCQKTVEVTLGQAGFVL